MVCSSLFSTFLIHDLCAIFASNSRFVRLFQAALDTCLGSPFFASLSVHGLHFTVYAPSTRTHFRTLFGLFRGFGPERPGNPVAGGGGVGKRRGGKERSGSKINKRRRGTAKEEREQERERERERDIYIYI